MDVSERTTIAIVDGLSWMVSCSGRYRRFGGDVLNSTPTPSACRRRCGTLGLCTRGRGYAQRRQDWAPRRVVRMIHQRGKKLPSVHRQTESHNAPTVPMMSSRNKRVPCSRPHHMVALFRMAFKAAATDGCPHNDEKTSIVTGGTEDWTTRRHKAEDAATTGATVS